jgi:hypothetical protein
MKELREFVLFFAFKMVGKNLKIRNFADSLLNNKE